MFRLCNPIELVTTTAAAATTTTATAAAAAAAATATTTTYLMKNFLLEFSWSLAITFRLQLSIKVSQLCFKVSPVWCRSTGIGP
jgi:hypothetical protein